MIIKLAEENDLAKWKIIAKDVAIIFGNPTMDIDLEFIEYAKRKIKQKEAFIAFDDMMNDFYGIIGFSKNFNRITWFGVMEKYRNKGIGSQLLYKTLNELDRTKEITVETYRENYIQGQPARYVYKKFGFIETEGNLFDKLGNERCKLSLYPVNNILFWKYLEKLCNENEIIIDRPKGSKHPKYEDMVYVVDYGYIKNTKSMDDGGIDIFVGSNENKEIDSIFCVIDLLKKDSEIKILMGCTKSEKNEIYNLLNNSEYMKAILINRKET